MRKKRITIIGMLLLMLCLPLAPVFSKWRWGSQPQAGLGEDQAYACLWLHRGDTFSYFGLCAFHTFEMRPTANLMLRDEQNRVQSVSIADAVAVVDGVEFPVPELEGVRLSMNRGFHNMYGGLGGTARPGFRLGAIPRDLVELRVRGTVTTENGEVLPLQITIHSTIRTKSGIMMLWQYLLMRLGE